MSICPTNHSKHQGEETREKRPWLKPVQVGWTVGSMKGVDVEAHKEDYEDGGRQEKGTTVGVKWRRQM